MMRVVVSTFIILLMIWAVFSMLASAILAENGNCHKTYPISYIFYTRLFCEVEPQGVDLQGVEQ